LKIFQNVQHLLSPESLGYRSCRVERRNLATIVPDFLASDFEGVHFSTQRFLESVSLGIERGCFSCPVAAGELSLDFVGGQPRLDLGERSGIATAHVALAEDQMPRATAPNFLYELVALEGDISTVSRPRLEQPEALPMCDAA
jgi:hypothetical protein